MERRTSFRMGREPVAIDILPEIPGVDFDRAWERRIEGGLKAYFISRDDLVSAKLAAGRPQGHCGCRRDS
jgi:hypothetical protein